MASLNESYVKMNKRSRSFAKSLGSVLKVGLLLIAVTGAACGDGSGGGGSSQAICVDACRWAYDGECDDGGDGSGASECQYGSDCSDCGPRDPADYNCCDDYRFWEDETACLAGLKDCP